MERIITGYVEALRASGVRVSPAEAIDAARAATVLGFAERGALKLGLGAALAKSPGDLAVHEALFDLYFSARERGSSESAPDSAAEGGESASDAAPATEEGDLLDLLDAAPATVDAAMEAAAAAVQINSILYATQTGVLAQRMLAQLGQGRLDAAILDALGERGDEDEARRLIDGRRRLMQRARERTEAAFKLYGRGRTAAFREEVLETRPLSRMDAREQERLQPVIAKLAKRLADKHGRRRRETLRGRLDLRATLRANAGSDAVARIVWKERRRDRARLHVICDVSGSVARFVRFFLMLTEGLGDAVADAETFVFSGHLEPAAPYLEDTNVSDAMERILRRVGGRSTDYGKAFEDYADHARGLTRQTSLIVLGDARSNDGPLRTDLFARYARQARRVVWLNPEPETLWGTGDSGMLRYRPHCTAALHVATVRDLERALDRVLGG